MTNDPVNHPAHYTTGKIECIDFITDKKLNFCRGNAVKYIVRAGLKDPAKEVEDLQKAVFYLNHEIQNILDRNKEQEAIEPREQEETRTWIVCGNCSQQSEPGTSLKASNWICDGKAGGTHWTGKRYEQLEMSFDEMKIRWHKDLV